MFYLGHRGPTRNRLDTLQTDWIRALRSNILLDSAYNEIFRDQLIHACGLRQDLEALPRRGTTKLGDNGSTLSGGQRQRLLCALFMQPRIWSYLLDDVFSALDGETKVQVFASLFGSHGLLKGRCVQTTVLVTHDVHHLPSADKVIIMSAGRIKHFGSFEEVRDAGATFALASNAGEAGAAYIINKESGTAATIVDEEEDEEWHWINEQPSRMVAYALYFSLSCVAVGLAYVGYTLGTFTAPHIHAAELDGTMRSPISWITKYPVGKILNRFSQDIQTADMEFPFAFLNFAVNLLGMVGTFVFIIMMTPLLALAFLPMAILGWCFLKFYIATSKTPDCIEISGLYGAAEGGVALNTHGFLRFIPDYVDRVSTYFWGTPSLLVSNFNPIRNGRQFNGLNQG
ncbi:P-loop containing nucleoside triphosphate hydrolase protein [Mycena capillaripes]|nr:P-loop containing nucleoside triphosphate hydrolase protein [Mycena capillaripes]